jgi:FkbM family methyltransferase
MAFFSSPSTWMNALLRPHYVARPSHLLERLWQKAPPDTDQVTVDLLWGNRLTVDPHSHIGGILWKHRIYDPTVSETLWRLADTGMMHVDVGAHVGYMSSLLASQTGPSGSVVAIEPHPDLVSCLKINAQRMREMFRTSICIHPVVLSSEDGQLTLFWDPTDSNLGRASVEDTPAGRKMNVRSRSFDALLPDEKIGVLKIDVEGHEAAVLRGARSALENHRIDHIIYEGEEDDNPSHEILHRYRYDIFELGWTPWAPAIWRLGAPPNGRRPPSPAFLATRYPDDVQRRLAPRGWKCLTTKP